MIDVLNLALPHFGLIFLGFAWLVQHGALSLAVLR
jgi:hypothetical protein